ncbi:MAG: HDOD domain-containing protein [Burkholderiaceae bacterium]|nr:HDOD domain-containing protein [Burkholderiaceae bacterium]
MSTSSFPTLKTALPDLAWWMAYFRNEEMPVLAATAEQLELWRANEDAVDANMMGEAIASDPLMTLKVLRYAAEHRSSRLLTDAETVTAALVLLGITPFFNAFGPQPTVEDRLEDNPQAFEGMLKVMRRADRAARFALGFAAHRMDPDAAVIHSAALLHDFAEILLWAYSPDLALEIKRRQQADPTLRSAVAQRQALHIELADLEQALMQEWHLPELLMRMTNDKRAYDPQVLCVKLAVRLARHTADGWDNPAVPDDLRDIGDLLNLSQPHTLRLLQDIDTP